jgi:hypothetical protein
LDGNLRCGLGNAWRRLGGAHGNGVGLLFLFINYGNRSLRYLLAGFGGRVMVSSTGRCSARRSRRP